MAPRPPPRVPFARLSLARLLRQSECAPSDATVPQRYVSSISSGKAPDGNDGLVNPFLQPDQPKGSRTSSGFSTGFNKIVQKAPAIATRSFIPFPLSKEWKSSRQCFYTGGGGGWNLQDVSSSFHSGVGPTVGGEGESDIFSTVEHGAGGDLAGSIVRESMDYDVVIVGAGPAGLSAAIRLKQLQPSLSVCVLEKGAYVGAHVLSGNVFEPRALSELLPDWKEDGAPLHVPVSADRFLFLTRSWHLPLPAPAANHGNYVISLSELVRWLAERAEQMGVEIYPGIAAAKLLLSSPHSSPPSSSSSPRLCGIITNDVGRLKDGTPGPNFQPGMLLRGRMHLLAEGCRGSLSQEVMRRFNLRSQGPQGKVQHQTYALGVKEVWEVPPSQHRPGEVLHTVGYPLDRRTYGGGFAYHMGDNKVSLGLVVALDYSNPTLSPYEEFQRWKLHPAISPLLQGGTVLQYGARALNEGGFQSIPSLSFPGGALIGCAAGFLNVPKIKGTHTAMKSGMVAAEAVHTALNALTVSFSNKSIQPEAAVANEAAAAVAAAKEAGAGTAAWAHERREGAAGLPGASRGEQSGADEQPPGALGAEGDRKADEEMKRVYERGMRESWVWEELRRVRNIRPGFRFGLLPGMAYAAAEMYLLRGLAPWTIPHAAPDHSTLKPLAAVQPIAYPKPDGRITFDILTSVYRSGTNHEHHQPSHLRLRDPALPSSLNLPVFGGPEAKYCPARVYEYLPDEKGGARLQINAQNCLHCKACDIKDPGQNIHWTVPEGGGGPSYTVM